MLFIIYENEISQSRIKIIDVFRYNNKNKSYVTLYSC